MKNIHYFLQFVICFFSLAIVFCALNWLTGLGGVSVTDTLISGLALAWAIDKERDRRTR